MPSVLSTQCTLVRILFIFPQLLATLSNIETISSKSLLAKALILFKLNKSAQHLCNLADRILSETELSLSYIPAYKCFLSSVEIELLKVEKNIATV